VGTYFVRIRATNGDGTGPPSNEETVVGGAPCNEPPNAPGPLIGSPPGPTFTLTWSPPIGGCPATSFVVRAGFSSGQVDYNANVGTNTSLSGTAATGIYYVRVVAVNAAGEGPPSNEVRIEITCAEPGPPVGLAANVNGNTVTLGWNPPTSGGAASGYVLEAGPSSGASTFSFALQGNTFSGVAPNGTYFVRVRATNTCGTSPPSNEVTLVVPSCGPNLGAPSTPTATVNGGTATISWNAVNGASSYRLEVGTAPGTSNAASVEVSGTTTQQSFNAGTYYMRVRALNACGSSGPVSGEGTFTITVPVTLTSITVTGPASLVTGQSGQFTATGHLSDGSTTNVTATAAWASSNGAVAAPGSAGTINALTMGTTNITASREGKTGTAALQVTAPTATFVIRNPNGSIATQCEVVSNAAHTGNTLLCRFDGSASVPDNATYAWEIPAGSPVRNWNHDYVDSQQLFFSCGSFGEAADYPVRLTVTVGSVTVADEHLVSFFRNGAC